LQIGLKVKEGANAMLPLNGADTWILKKID
jgi:hypothetical protein